LLVLIRFLPALLTSLLGGAVADSYDRRWITVISQSGPLAASVALFLLTRAGSAQLPVIYLLVFGVALSSAFENPARQALLPQLVSRETFANAVTLNSALQQLGAVAGPSLAGLLIAVIGVAGAYAAHLGIVLLGVVPLLLLRLNPDARERRAVSLAAITEGIQFVWRRQVLLGAMTLDLMAVIFGGATALLPIYAQSILHVGAAGYGLLSSSLSIGALLMSVVLIAFPPVQHTGRALLWAVAGFGLATILFGLSRSYPLSLLAYGLTGSADQVSVIMRTTTIQLATPDALRGRVSSVGSIFIGASNQVGALESGVVAAVTTATFAVVSGGVACLAVVAAIGFGMPRLRRYRIGDETAGDQNVGGRPSPMKS
jgi:MFS family permease